MNNKFDTVSYNYTKILPLTNKALNNLDLSLILKLPNLPSILSSENDSKQYSNPFKFVLNPKYKKKLIWNLNYLMNDHTNLDLVRSTETFTAKLFNTENILKFKDYKSSNLQFLGSERTSRLLTNINNSAFKWNTASSPNVITSIIPELITYGGNSNKIYKNSSDN